MLKYSMHRDGDRPNEFDDTSKYFKNKEITYFLMPLRTLSYYIFSHWSLWCSQLVPHPPRKDHRIVQGYRGPSSVPFRRRGHSEIHRIVCEARGDGLGILDYRYGFHCFLQ